MLFGFRRATFLELQRSAIVEQLAELCVIYGITNSVNSLLTSDVYLVIQTQVILVATSFDKKQYFI